MFFSIQLLGRGTPLSTLWLAAHADSRLKRNDINTTSVKNSVEDILHSETPLALRLSGMLMLGVVRIYKRQLQYLYDDCQSTISKLEKADKQASKRATEKAGGRSSKASLQAKDADISIPDGPAKMFNFAALDADEEGFGLFDDHHSSSMAALDDVEAQHSFQNIDAELFSQLGPEDSMDPSSDGPERLRAVSEFSEDLGPALPPMDDMLPRMTPKKKGDGNSEVPSPHVSRDDSVNRGSLARTSFGNVDQDEMLPADLEMENMDLPPMLPPADEEVGGGANVPDSQAHRNEEEVAAMDEDPPAPPPDDFPAAPPEDFPEAPPEDFPGAPPEDFPMEEPPVNPDVDEVMNDVAEPAVLEADPIVEDEQEVAPEPQPAPGPDEVEDVPRPVPKPRRKKQGTGQRLRRDAQNNKLSTDEVREMLKNRKPIFRQRLPLVALPLQQENWLHTDDLDLLMQPRSLREENLNPGMRLLLKSIGSCNPVSFFAFMGDSSGVEKEAQRANEAEDEIEEDDEAGGAAKVPKKRKSRNDAQDDQEQELPDPEDLRNASPFPAAGQGVDTPHCGFEVNVPGDPGTREPEDEVQQADDAMLDADQMPMDDAPPPMDMDFPPPMGDDFPEPLEDLPEMPPPDQEDEAVPGASQHEQEPPFAPGADGPSQDGAHEMQEEMWGGPSMPASQPSQDTSLNPHTVLTLSKLQELSQSQPGSSKKRDREQHIFMSSLTHSCSRSEAAKCFYDVLVLQAKGVLHMTEQTVEYEDLRILLLDEET